MHVNVKIWNLTSSKYRTVNVLWNEICDFYVIFTELLTKRKKFVLTFLYHMKDHLS